MKDILFYLTRGRILPKEAKQLLFSILLIGFVIGCAGNPLACQTVSVPKIIYVEGDGGKSTLLDSGFDNEIVIDVQSDLNQD